MAKAGAATLMTPELVTTLCEHAAGNYRTLMTMAQDLLATGVEHEVKQLDEKLFFDTYTPVKAQPAASPVKLAQGKRR
jgi:peptide deformylase